MALTFEEINEMAGKIWTPKIRKALESIFGKEVIDGMSDEEVLDLWKMTEV